MTCTPHGCCNSQINLQLNSTWIGLHTSGLLQLPTTLKFNITFILSVLIPLTGRAHSVLQRVQRCRLAYIGKSASFAKGELNFTVKPAGAFAVASATTGTFGGVKGICRTLPLRGLRKLRVKIRGHSHHQ